MNYFIPESIFTTDYTDFTDKKATDFPSVKSVKSVVEMPFRKLTTISDPLIGPAVAGLVKSNSKNVAHGLEMLVFGVNAADPF